MIRPVTGQLSSIVPPSHADTRVSGYTVVEVLMAAAILSVGFIGLIQGITVGSEELDTSRKQQVATQIVSGEIERLRSGSWTAIANLPASASIAIDGTGAISGDQTSFALSNYTASTADDNTVLSSLGKRFSCSFVRTRLRPGLATASTVTFVKIVYTVSWASNTGRTYTRSTEAYLGKNGLHLSYQKS
jgi:Tfp pilus assembly protein PilV